MNMSNWEIFCQVFTCRPDLTSSIMKIETFKLVLRWVIVGFKLTFLEFTPKRTRWEVQKYFVDNEMLKYPVRSELFSRSNIKVWLLRRDLFVLKSMTLQIIPTTQLVTSPPLYSTTLRTSFKSNALSGTCNLSDLNTFWVEIFQNIDEECVS